MARVGEIVWNISGFDDIHAALTRIERKVDAMATDQATFDAALTDFLSDLEAGLAAIQAKLDAVGAPVDLTAELAQITAAKAKLDAQVAADTTPPAA